MFTYISRKRDHKNSNLNVCRADICKAIGHEITSVYLVH